jgi:hypothetical protein
VARALRWLPQALLWQAQLALRVLAPRVKGRLLRQPAFAKLVLEGWLQLERAQLVVKVSLARREALPLDLPLLQELQEQDLQL